MEKNNQVVLCICGFRSSECLNVFIWKKLWIVKRRIDFARHKDSDTKNPTNCEKVDCIAARTIHSQSEMLKQTTHKWMHQLSQQIEMRTQIGDAILPDKISIRSTKSLSFYTIVVYQLEIAFLMLTFDTRIEDYTLRKLKSVQKRNVKKMCTIPGDC